MGKRRKVPVGIKASMFRAKRFSEMAEGFLEPSLSEFANDIFVFSQMKEFNGIFFKPHTQDYMLGSPA